MKGILFWLLGILSGSAAVYFLFNHNLATPNWGPGLFFAAVALGFWAKAYPPIQPLPEPAGPGAKRGIKKTAPLPFPSAFAIALSLGLAGVLFYFGHLWLGFFPLLVLAVLLIVRRADVVWDGPGPDRSDEWKWVCLVVGAAILLRFPFLAKNYFGLQIDEANGWWIALVVALNSGSPFTLVAYGTAPFLTGIFFNLFGISIVSAHASTCLMSVLAAYFFFRWCRLHFSLPGSVIASLLFTFSWWNLFFSFSGIPNIFLMTFETGAMYFLDKGFHKGKKGDFALAGFFFGLSALTYWGGRILPLVVISSVLGLMVWEGRKFIQAYGRPLLMSLLLFLTIVGPFLAYWYVTPSDVLWGRYKELSIMTVIQRTQDYFLPVRTAFWTLAGYFCPGACVIDPRFCSPDSGLVDGFSGIFFLFGVLLCLINWKRRVVFLAAGGLALGIAANALAAQNLPACQNYINPCRSFIILPYVFFFAARGLDWYLGQASRVKGTLGRSVGIVLLVAGFLAGLGANLGIYFYKFGNNQYNWGDLGFDHLQVSQELSSYYPKDHIVLFYAYDNTPVRFLHYGKIQYAPWYKLELPIKNRVEKDVALFFPPSEFSKEAEEMSRYYPGAKIKAIRTPWGAEYMRVAEIPKEEVLAAQKGMKTDDPLP